MKQDQVRRSIAKSKVVSSCIRAYTGKKCQNIRAAGRLCLGWRCPPSRQSQFCAQAFARRSRGPRPSRHHRRGTRSRQSPSTWPCKGPSLGSPSPLKSRSASANSQSSSSFLGLPTRVPISANNNIHMNRFLDHSPQNTRASRQQGRLRVITEGAPTGPRRGLLASPLDVGPAHSGAAV